jgi:hypothetical protein
VLRFVGGRGRYGHTPALNGRDQLRRAFVENLACALDAALADVEKLCGLRLSSRFANWRSSIGSLSVRKRASAVKVEGRKSYAEGKPETVALAQRLAREPLDGKRRGCGTSPPNLPRKAMSLRAGNSTRTPLSPG